MILIELEVLSKNSKFNILNKSINYDNNMFKKIK